MTGSPLSGSNQRIGGNPVSTKSSCVSIVVPNKDGRNDKGTEATLCSLDAVRSIFRILAFNAVTS